MKVLLVFCLFLLPVLAQQDAAPAVSARPSGAAEPPSSGEVDRRITLDVAVTDKSGKPIAGLQQQDFTVLDGTLPQKIVSFEAVDAATAKTPVHVILLVDAVNASFEVVASGLQEIKKFLGEDGGKLVQPVSVALFSDAGVKEQSDFTRDGKALIAFLNKNEVGLRTVSTSAGFNGARERLQMSLQALGSLVDSQAQTAGRKMLIWVGPGWPILAGPRMNVSAQGQELLFNNIVALSTGLRQAGFTLYSVDPLGMGDAGGFQTFRYKDFVKGVTTPKQTGVANLALQVVAYQSGGRVLNSSNDIAGEIAACVEDANAYYVLSFDSPAPDGPVEYHGLEIKISKDGLAGRTRTGYYAQR